RAILILSIAVGGFGLSLGVIIVERMKRGYVTTQDLEAKKYPCVMHIRVSPQAFVSRRCSLISKIYRRLSRWYVWQQLRSFWYWRCGLIRPRNRAKTVSSHGPIYRMSR